MLQNFQFLLEPEVFSQTCKCEDHMSLMKGRSSFFEPGAQGQRSADLGTAVGARALSGSGAVKALSSGHGLRFT